MRVVLFTIWHEANYGAEMQTYATVRALQEAGCEVQVANLLLSDARQYSLRGRVSKAVEPIWVSFRDFYRFWRTNIPTTKRYKTLEAIMRDPPKADLYLVGSDQVWNPAITQSLAPLFFLPFENQRRAAYASSFGVEQWKGADELTQLARANLRSFVGVGCREASGCALLRDVFGIEAVETLDPTLLHASYDELTGAVVPNNSMVYYPLHNDPQLDALAEQIAAAMHAPLLNANEKHRLPGGIVWRRTPIEEWLRRIGGARFVFTHSFHGLAFSLIYKRNFAILINSSKGTRIRSLLARLGLDDRCFDTQESLLASRVWERPIDYERVGPLLDALRRESREFLNRVVNLE